MARAAEVGLPPGEHVRLPDVTFIDAGVAGFLGQALRPGDVRSLNLGFTIDWQPGADGHLLLRFHVQVGLYDKESETDDPPPEEHKLAALEYEVVCEYSVREDLSVLRDESLLRALIERHGLPDVFPYLRELTSSMAGRLGFHGVVLQSIPSGGVSNWANFGAVNGD